MDSPVLAASPPGIGDLCFMSPEFVAAAAAVLQSVVSRRSKELAQVPGEFVLCEVGHNPPWHSSNYGERYRTESKPYVAPMEHGPGRVVYGTRLAWWLRIRGASVATGQGELPAAECDLKIQGDHSVMSRLARLVRRGTDPEVLKAAEEQLKRQSLWKMEGRDRGRAAHPAFAAVLDELHEALAPRVMPRTVWMSRDWVATAREVIAARAREPRLGGSAKHEPALGSFRYVFAEVFEDPPRYVSPDGSSVGFWIDFDHSDITVGAGTLPPERGVPDKVTKGQYIPILPLGRTVEAALNGEERRLMAEYSKNLPRTFNGKKTFEGAGALKDGSKDMPKVMSICMLAIHDELALRTSGEIPSDFDPAARGGGAAAFDRHPEYSGTWLRYDKVDVYGRPLPTSKL